MITFDHEQHLINLTNQSILSVQELIDSIRTHEATSEGVGYPVIGKASGKEMLDFGVSVGITVELVSPWQVKFEDGNYIAKIAGGNLTGGIVGDPVAYSPGVQVLLVQSAASTIVTSDGSAASPEVIAEAVWNNTSGDAVANTTEYLEKIVKNKKRITTDKRLVIYDDDNVTEILSKGLKDIDGNEISDIGAGVLAIEEVSSV